MKTSTVNTFILVLSMAFSASCVEDVNMTTDEERPVVVDCVLRMQPVQTLRLYQASDFSGNNYTPIEDALVSLRATDTDGNTVVYMFLHKEDDLWECEHTPEYGGSYTLEVRLDDGQTISASTDFPDNVRMVTTNREIDNTDKHLGPASDETYYQAYSSRICNWTHHSGGSYDEDSGVVIDEWYSYDHPYTGALKIWIFPHTTYSREAMPEGDYTMYDFQNKCYAEYSESDAPLANYVVTDHPGADDFNIAGGVLSDLSWYDRELVTDESYYRSRFLNFTRWALFMCPDLPLHEKFVRIDHEANFSNGLSLEELLDSYLFTDNSFHVGADYSMDYPLIGYAKATIGFAEYVYPDPQFSFANEVHFVSDEYDAYLRDLWTTYKNEDNFLLSSYGGGEFYSNVKGGKGIFGADLTTWEISYTSEYFSDSWIANQ